MNIKHFFIIALGAGSLNYLHAQQIAQAQEQEQQEQKQEVRSLPAWFERLSKIIDAQSNATRNALQGDYVVKLTLERRMINEAQYGTLTKENLEAYLKGGADINATEDFGNTALISAAYKGHTDTVQLLITAGADINAKTRDGGTALHSAIVAGHKEMVELLIAQGADVNVKDDHGTTPLITAATWMGKVEIAQLLITKGADIQAKNCCGITALMEAARGMHKEVIQLLIAHGADVNAKDNYDRIARDFVSNYGRHEISLLALKKDCYIKIYDEIVAVALKEYQEKIEAKAASEEKEMSSK